MSILPPKRRIFAALALAAALTLLGACSPGPAALPAASPPAPSGPTSTPTPSPAASPTASQSPARAPAVPIPTVASPSATPTRAAAGPAGLAGRVVVVDPGHNGQNWAHPTEINRLVDIGNGTKACDTTGAATPSGYSEAAYNLDVAKRLAALLNGAGVRVVLTRADNNGWGPCIDERAAIGNREHADAAISIHADGSTTGRGFHVISPVGIPGLTDDIAGPSGRLALDVRDAYAHGTGLPHSTYAGHEGLIQRSDLGGLNLSRVPKVFIETGNMRSPADAALLEDPAFRSRAAEALASGLEAYLAGR